MTSDEKSDISGKKLLVLSSNEKEGLTEIPVEIQGDNVQGDVEFVSEDFYTALGELEQERLKQFGFDADHSDDASVSSLVVEDMIQDIKKNGMAGFLAKVKSAVNTCGYDFSGTRDVVNKRSGRNISF